MLQNSKYILLNLANQFFFYFLLVLVLVDVQLFAFVGSGTIEANQVEHLLIPLLLVFVFVNV